MATRKTESAPSRFVFVNNARTGPPQAREAGNAAVRLAARGVESSIAYLNAQIDAGAFTEEFRSQHPASSATERVFLRLRS